MHGRNKTLVFHRPVYDNAVQVGHFKRAPRPAVLAHVSVITEKKKVPFFYVVSVFVVMKIIFRQIGSIIFACYIIFFHVDKFIRSRILYLKLTSVNPYIISAERYRSFYNGSIAVPENDDNIAVIRF